MSNASVMQQLPDIEMVAAAVHESWMQGKRASGITSRKAEDGEELMVPYHQLSAKQQEIDRSLVLNMRAYQHLAHCSKQTRTKGRRAWRSSVCRARSA